MQRTDSLEKTLLLGRLKVGREGDDGGWNGWIASPTQWTWVWARSGSWWWTGKPGMLQSYNPWGQKSRTRLSDWTELTDCFLSAPPLSMYLLPSLISICLNLLFGTHGSVSLLPTNEKWGTQTASMPSTPQGRAQFHDSCCFNFHPFLLFCRLLLQLSNYLACLYS